MKDRNAQKVSELWDSNERRRSLPRLGILTQILACGGVAAFSWYLLAPVLFDEEAVIRRPSRPEFDNPCTTNDESNDQPLGHFGTVTLLVHNSSSGNYYTLDADVESGDLERLYFPKGGWVDFENCDLDSDLTGDCIDENGKEWSIEGTGERRRFE